MSVALLIDVRKIIERLRLHTKYKFPISGLMQCEARIRASIRTFCPLNFLPGWGHLVRGALPARTRPFVSLRYPHQD